MASFMLYAIYFCLGWLYNWSVCCNTNIRERLSVKRQTKHVVVKEKSEQLLSDEQNMISKLKFAVNLKVWRITIRIPEISGTDDGNEKAATV